MSGPIAARARAGAILYLAFSQVVGLEERNVLVGPFRAGEASMG